MRGFTGRSMKAAAAFLLSGSLLTGAAATAYGQAQMFMVSLDGNTIPFTIGGAPTTVRAGTPLTFNSRNPGPAGDTSARHTHNLAIEGPNGMQIPSPGPNITGGQAATYTFQALQPGSYVLYCPVGQHRANGMAVNFTVVAGASALPATGGFAVPAGLAVAGLAAGAAGVALRRRS
jgi:FtsP/CotA-like multicopper oxidase with cupredoxin domain